MSRCRNHAVEVTPAVLVTFRYSKNRLHMKSLFLALGFLGMVFTSTAQNASLSSNGSSKVTFRTEINAGVIYARLVSFKQTNTEIVRFKMDDVVMRCSKIRSSENIDAMRKYRFEVSVEALNVLSSQGWKVHSTFVVRGRQGDEQALLDVLHERISPLYPWRERGRAQLADAEEQGRGHLARQRARCIRLVAIWLVGPPSVVSGGRSQVDGPRRGDGVCHASHFGLGAFGTKRPQGA